MMLGYHRLFGGMMDRKEILANYSPEQIQRICQRYGMKTELDWLALADRRIRVNDKIGHNDRLVGREGKIEAFAVVEDVDNKQHLCYSVNIDGKLTVIWLEDLDLQ